MKRSGFEMEPLGVTFWQMPKVNLLLGRVNDRPDIFANPFFVERPYFVEERDRALHLHFANDMNPPSGNGQTPHWDQLVQRRYQAKGLEGLAHLLRRFPIQRWWTILRGIPLRKVWHLGLHIV